MEKREIQFDGWRVEFTSGDITKDGRTLRLQDQPLQILDELTRHAGQVVTRETLIARLWPKGVVEFDTGLNTAVRKLRQALGDDPDAPRYIETLPRKGYRFIAPLTAGATPAAAASTRAVSVAAPADDGAPSGRRASDRNAPLGRLAWGFGSLLAAGVLAVVACHRPGPLFLAKWGPALPTML
jgi:DNA-binding winged helix-turn-helix (wHTH) protein